MENFKDIEYFNFNEDVLPPFNELTYLLYHDDYDKWMSGHLFNEDGSCYFLSEHGFEGDDKIDVHEFSESIGGMRTGVVDIEGVDILNRQELSCKNKILWNVCYFDGGFKCYNQKGDFFRLCAATVIEHELSPENLEYYGRA